MCGSRRLFGSIAGNCHVPTTDINQWDQRTNGGAAGHLKSQFKSACVREEAWLNPSYDESIRRRPCEQLCSETDAFSHFPYHHFIVVTQTWLAPRDNASLSTVVDCGAIESKCQAECVLPLPRLLLLLLQSNRVFIPASVICSLTGPWSTQNSSAAKRRLSSGQVTYCQVTYFVYCSEWPRIRGQYTALHAVKPIQSVCLWTGLIDPVNPLTKRGNNKQPGDWPSARNAGIGQNQPEVRHRGSSAHVWGAHKSTATHVFPEKLQILR